MNTILVRFAAGGVRKLNTGASVLLNVGDKFTLSTIYYEFQLLKQDEPQDSLDLELEDTRRSQRRRICSDKSRFLPKLPADAPIPVPNNTPQTLSDLGLSRLPSALAALPGEASQFCPKTILCEPLTPTNTPQTTNTQTSICLSPLATPLMSPQNSMIFTDSRASSRLLRVVGELDLLDTDENELSDYVPTPSRPSNTSSKATQIVKSTSANDIFLTSEMILTHVKYPLTLQYEPTLPPCSPRTTNLEKQESAFDLKAHLSKDAFENYQCSLQIETDSESNSANSASEDDLSIKEEKTTK